MSDHIRGISSPLSSSPGRPSVLSRPHWPWTTYPTHRSSQSSLHSLSNQSNPQSPYDARTVGSSNSPRLHASSMPWSSSRPGTSAAVAGFPSQEESTRQWSFTAFEWIVRDVHKLRNFVEGCEVEQSDETTAPEPDDFEILKESPMIGEGKFKLEIARTPQPDSGTATETETTPTLSVYITSLMLDFPHSDFAMSASMMTAIKCQDDRVGERGARAEWVWEHWQSDWTFRHESEVWECPLPPLSTLLNNPRIRDTDSFVVCVQIHCPVGPFYPQQPSAYFVPRDLLDGLEASLDNSNTGDVRFVCLERLSQQQPYSSPTLSPPSTARSKSRSSTSSSYSPFSSQTTARKRIIYAHSDILTRRSEYFSTMLASAFSENAAALAPGERKLYTVVVEEADFDTIYWLLKWVYANWLLFREHDDPREAVDGVGAGWSASWLNARGPEWDWKTFRKTGVGEESQVLSRDDARSTASPESATTSAGKGKQPGASTPSTRSTPATARQTPSKTPTNSASTSRQTSSTTPRRPAPPSTSSPSGASPNMPVPISEPVSGLSRTKPIPITLSVSTSAFATSQHYPITQHAQRQHPRPPSAISSPDPHPHPTPPPQPASALSMYQVAHRYAMPGLAALALEHLMSTITPQSSFALLLATSVWDELSSMVEDYVVEKWDQVSVSEEFEQCCQEVAAGEWGTQGGKTLMALFRRLRSPS
ncbi:hypothetical protein PLICRDRAFT_128240, partial [Plicaturopsis crispa FD-325 SS-3]